MPNKILDNIKLLQEFNSNYAVAAGGEENEVLDDGRKLKKFEGGLRRLETARSVKTAVGVFGESQCGKSFLVSELTGGKSASIAITGMEGKNFQDYNQTNADKESTAVVTRFTIDKISDIPDEHVCVRYLNHYEVMWSFVYGFYSELRFTDGFNLSKEQEQTKTDEINNADVAGEGIPDPLNFSSEFNDCLQWAEEKGIRNIIANAALEYLYRHNEDTFRISVEKFIFLASTLWYCDKNITNAFRARIETLKYLGFTFEGYLPECILKDVLNAATLDKISLSYNNQEIFPVNQTRLMDLDNATDPVKRLCLQNLQTVIREVILPIDSGDESLLPNMDVLDFPGARALTGLEGADASQIESDIEDGTSKILAGVYKRGKLLYLFDLYRKNYDITLLLFCSENRPQGAPVLKTMLEKWIKIDPYQYGDDASLFVAFTKSDQLLKGENLEEANNLITGRFKDNFADFYGSWTYYEENNKTFSNFYFVRNPQVKNVCFDNQSGGEVWRNGFKMLKEIFYQASNNNELANRYLGSEMENLFDQVFQPNETGISNLRENIDERFNKFPNKKAESLDIKEKYIKDWLIDYKNKYFAGDLTAAQAIQQENALSFVGKLKKTREGLPIILNNIMERCPDESYLDSLITQFSGISNAFTIVTENPLKEGIPKFIKDWLRKCKDGDFHKQVGVERSDLDRFFDNLGKYLTNSSFLDPLVKDFIQIFDTREDKSNIIVIRNYLLWVIGEKVYYLEKQDANGTPKEPIEIPSEIDFTEYILNIWKEQLPEIYVQNFQMKKPGNGEKLLKQVVFE